MDLLARLPTWRAVLLAGLLMVSACQTDSPSPQPTGSSGPSSSASPDGTAANLAVSEALRNVVTPAAIHDRLEDLYAIAQANDGIRAAGTTGHGASMTYVQDVLEAAGYTVTRDEFTFPFFFQTSPATIAVTGGATFTGDEHLRALIFSRSGDVTAPVVAVAVNPDGSTIGSGGCERADWVDFPAGAIAIAGPGRCFRRDMVEQAQIAQAAALVISSPAYEPGAVRRPTLLDPGGIEIPALYASNVVGEALREAAAAGGSVHLTVQTMNEERRTANVLAERLGSGPGATPEQVIMIGGHLDSVIDGPGINDNGSGTMTVLELAERLAALGPTQRTVRFAFWTGEELGLFGSTNWVQQQDEDSLHAIVAYLNFDMVASPNYSRLVYDSSSAVADSGPITTDFERYFDAVGLSYEALDLGASSDHYPFDQSLVPTGGLFSGASEVKTDEEAELFGGTAGEPMDPCYHLACDGPDQINDIALDEFSDAAAHVLMLLLQGG
jgi:hypothetical protein